jgi:tetratricopeptide (TPR) repeat protein
VEALDLLGYVLDETARFDEGVSMFERALAIRRSMPGTPETEILENESNLAYLEMGAGRYDQAARRFRSVAARRDALSTDGNVNLSAHSGLGVALLQADRLDEARVVLEDVLKRQEARSPTGRDRAATLGPLGRLALVQGRLEAAEARCRQASDLRSATNWGDWSRASDLRCLGAVSALRGQTAAAKAYFEDSLGKCSRLFGPASFCEAETRLEEGRTALESCRLEAAERSLGEARSTFAAILPASHPMVSLTAAEIAKLPSARTRCGTP